MTTYNRTTLCAAMLIHVQLAQHGVQDISRCLSEYSWTAAARLRRQIGQARRRNWHRAAARLVGDLRTTLYRCQRELETALHTIESSTSVQHTASVAEVYQDIAALQEEFEEVEIDVAEHEVCVTTDAIVLEGIDLGRFQIRLNWDRLATPHPYRVVALEPNPAATNEEVTHPHVQDETLCEGDGRAAIHASLVQGRLYDFFLLVAQVLHTYARGSAYVEADAWDGITCDDCGTHMREDDRYTCSCCGSSLCEECSHYCTGCEEPHCSGCLATCPECERDFCRGCLTTCAHCRRKICDSCREDDLCPTCQAQRFEEEQDDESDQATDEDGSPQSPAGDAGAATEPDRLGEAPVPA